MNRFALPLLLAAAPAFGQVGGVCTQTNTINFCVHEDSDGLPESEAEGNDRFGSALAFGDFDGDGFPDLAVGIPGDRSGRGAVHVYRGSASNTRIAPLIITQNLIGGQEARVGENFGFALAAGDINGDGIDDLAVSAPHESTWVRRCRDPFYPQQCIDDGVVHVFTGTVGGLVPSNALTIDVGDVDQGFLAADHGLGFGSSLAIGDLDGDGMAELAIGAPHTVRAPPVRDAGAGAIFVVAGSASGPLLGRSTNIIFGLDNGGALQQSNQGAGPMRVNDVGGVPHLVVGQPFYDESGWEDSGAVLTYRLDVTQPAPRRYPLVGLIRQTSFGLAGQSSHDNFGHAIDVGDFNADGFSDLVVGTPGKNIPVGGQTVEDGGRIYVVYGSATGFNFSTIQVFDQSLFPGQSAQRNDGFGFAVAAGDISGDGIDDVVLGAPGESSTDTGFFYFLVGSPQRLRVATSATPDFSGGFNASQLAIGGSNGNDDHFGMVLAVSDVTGDGQAEIAIGVPDKDVAGHADAGMLYVTRRLQAVE